MSFRVYFTIELDQSAVDVFKANDVEVVVARGHLSEEEYVEDIKKYQPDAIMCRTEPVSKAMMDAALPKLQVVGKQGVGLDNIDMDYATSVGLQVVFAPQGNSNSVAEHAMFLLLACARRFHYVDGIYRGGNFGVRYTLHNTFELEGMTLGLIGCGRIGQSLANKAAHGFGMKVVGYDLYAKQENLNAPITLLPTMDEVLEQADFVSLHVPATPQTRNSFTAAQFAKMKPTASFINTCRGEVVVEQDMIDALESGKIMGAGLDVFAHEPLDMNSPLMTMPSVVTTPHTAATTEQAVTRCCKTTATDICNVLYGRPLNFPANKVK